MTVEPIYNEKALLIDDHLVIADLHLGLEHELESSGVKIPAQDAPMTKRITNLLKESSALHLVILGDLKHNIPNISWHEYSQIPPMIKTLSSYADVTVIKGNHDGNIEKLLPDVPVVKSLEIGDSLLFHGHTKIPEKQNFSRIIAGHNHPCIEFHDEIKSTRESAWIRARLKSGVEVIIMPAFNDLIFGTPINAGKKLLGPLFNQIDLKDADAYLLDGTHLRVKDLLK
jgi:putative SbcD/Mre11-related phosphoesterase